MADKIYVYKAYHLFFLYHFFQSNLHNSCIYFGSSKIILILFYTHSDSIISPSSKKTLLFLYNKQFLLISLQNKIRTSVVTTKLTCCDTGLFCVSVFWVLFWLPQSTLVLCSAQLSLLKFAYSEGRGGGGMLGGGAEDSCCTCKWNSSLFCFCETGMQGQTKTNLSWTNNWSVETVHKFKTSYL